MGTEESRHSQESHDNYLGQPTILSKETKRIKKGSVLIAAVFGGFNSLMRLRFSYLYYIPLIPMSKRKRFHKMCSHCSMTQQIDIESFNDIIQSLKSNSAEAVLAILDGEKTFSLEGTIPNQLTHRTIAGGCDWLYASGNKDFCVSIVGQLADPVGRFTQAMLLAHMRTNGRQATGSDRPLQFRYANRCISLRALSVQKVAWKRRRNNSRPQSRRINKS